MVEENKELEEPFYDRIEKLVKEGVTDKNEIAKKLGTTRPGKFALRLSR